jgi:P27 family predicted phage terminase small subunit
MKTNALQIADNADALIAEYSILRPDGPAEAIGDPPPHLDRAARKKWKELSAALGGMGQGDAVAAYCVAWSRWAKAEEEIKKLGEIVKSPSGFPVANPWLAVSDRASRDMGRWGKVLRLV